MGKAYTCKGNCGRSLGLIYLNISMKKNCESGSAEQSLETFSLPTCPLREEKSLSQRAFSIYTDIRKLQDKAKTSYTLSTRRLRFGYE